MTTRDERFAQIEANWFDVMKNYYRDMAAAKTEDQTRAIEDNYHAAEAAYLDALKAALAKTGDNIESAFNALKKANDDIKSDRDQAAQFAKLLDDLQAATKFAISLLALA